MIVMRVYTENYSIRARFDLIWRLHIHGVVGHGLDGAWHGIALD